MEKEENEIVNEEINKNQNNLKETKITPIKEKDANYKTTKSFNMLPLIQRSANETFRSSFDFNKIKNGPIINQQDYDPNLLKKELSLLKSDMHMKKNELLKLKIKYSKLNDENVSNKNLISTILGISLDKYLSREAVFDKIENCQLSDVERERLQEAYDKIKLKLEIADKKLKISEQNVYIEELKKNSKTKIINELESDYYSKCEKQRRFLRNLKKLEEKYENCEKEIKKLNEEIEEFKKEKNNLKKKGIETKNKYENNIQEKNNLQKQNKLLDEKIKKYIITNREKSKSNKDKERGINNKEEYLKEINYYIAKRETFLKHVDKKKK